MEVWDVTISVVIRVLKFGERVVMRRTFYPRIVNADFLACPQIIIDDHAARTNDGHFANFSWLEPAVLDGCDAFTRERQRHVCHILDSRRDVIIPLAVNCRGQFVHNLENDRYNIRWYIPTI